MDEKLKAELAALDGLLQTFKQDFPPRPLPNEQAFQKPKPGVFGFGTMLDTKAYGSAQFYVCQHNIAVEHIPQALREVLKRLSGAIHDNYYGRDHLDDLAGQGIRKFASGAVSVGTLTEDGQGHYLQPDRIQSVTIQAGGIKHFFYAQQQALDPRLSQILRQVSELQRYCSLRHGLADAPAELLAIYLTWAATWPPEALAHEIAFCQEHLATLNRQQPFVPPVAFTGQQLIDDPLPAERAFFEDLLPRLQAFHSTAAPHTVTVSIPAYVNAPEPKAEESNFKILRLLASVEDPVSLDHARQWLTAITRTQQPFSFLFVGHGRTAEIFPAFVVPPTFTATFESLTNSFFPNAQIEEVESHQWPVGYQAVAEYRLEPTNTLLKPFTDFNPDPLALFCIALEQLEPDEQALLCLDINHIATSPFCCAPKQRENVLASRNSRLSEAESKRKASSAFFVALKILVAASPARAEFLLQRLQEALGQYNSPSGTLSRWTLDHEHRFLKSLPASSGELNEQKFLRDVCLSLPPPLWKQSIFTVDELTSFIHPPHKSIPSTWLMRPNSKQKSIPEFLTTTSGLHLGSAEYRKQQYQIRLPHNLRTRHTYIVGASGSGKSNLLKTAIRQDIEEGRGLCVIDPHGDLVTDVLPFIPKKRLDDLIIFNPSDRDFPVSLNPFVPTTDDNRNDVALTFKTAFIRLFNVGDEARRMLNILHFTTLALLEAGNKTFLDIRRFLINLDFRDQVLGTINDPTVLEFWYEEYPRNYPKGAAAPISTRLAQFALSPVTRNILGQPQQAFDLYEVMNSGKILLCPLGKIQEEERQLLGSLLVSQIQLATMRRAEMPEADRRPFMLYMDEFQNFASDTDSLEKILSEARKYNLGLILAHQFTTQIPMKLADAIMANAFTKIIFRVGVDDARYLQKALTDYTDQDLQNQNIGQAVLCAGRAQDSFTLKTERFPDPPTEHLAGVILEHSRKTYGRPRAEIEAELRPKKPTEVRPSTAESDPSISATETAESKNQSGKGLFDELMG